MHSWGDLDDQGRDICYRVGEAADFIGNYMAQYGRLFVSCSKEKFGTVRVYIYGSFSLHQMFWPRHHWIHKWWPQRLDNLFCKIFGFIINPIWNKWFVFWYRRAYRKGLEKWPDLRNEILGGADCPDLLIGL